MKTFAIGVLIGLTFGAGIFTAMQIGLNVGYQMGYKQGFRDVPELTVDTFRAMMIGQTDFMNKSCYAWWFKMDTTERRLK